MPESLMEKNGKENKQFLPDLSSVHHSLQQNCQYKPVAV